MADPCDSVDLTFGRRPVDTDPAHPAPRSARPWISVWFRCCHVYARIYRTADGARYTGRCPRCGAEVSARVGPGGTNRRFFQAS